MNGCRNCAWKGQKGSETRRNNSGQEWRLLPDTVFCIRQFCEILICCPGVQNSTESKQDCTGEIKGKVLNPGIIWYKIHFGSGKTVVFRGDTGK